MIQALESSKQGLVPQTTELSYSAIQAEILLTSLSKTQCFQLIEKDEFDKICDVFEGEKYVKYPSYDAVNHRLIKTKKPSSGAEFFLVKHKNKIVAARFNTTLLGSGDIQNIFYFKPHEISN